MTKINLDTYCSFAFTGYDTRNKHICCKIQSTEKYNSFKELSDSEEVRTLRQNLLNGIKDPKCYECWNEDSVNKTSMRKWSLRNKTDDILLSEISQPKLKNYILDSSNACNLACRTCGPWSSSTIVKERKEKVQHEKWKTVHVGEIKKTNVEQFLTEDFSTVENIDVLGGEPLSNLEHFEVLEKIIKDGYSKNCIINYSTNGTVKITERHLDIMFKFNKICIVLSYDAIGKKAEYIRTGCSWDTVNENFQVFKKLRDNNKNLYLECHPTISALNILYLDELFSWLEENNIHKFYDFCYYPEEYSFQLFNDKQKNLIIEHLKKSKFDMSPIIAHVEKWKHDPSLASQFWNQIEWTKEYWGLDIKDYLPELYQLLKEETIDLNRSI